MTQHEKPEENRQILDFSSEIFKSLDTSLLYKNFERSVSPSADLYIDSARIAIHEKINAISQSLWPMIEPKIDKQIVTQFAGKLINSSSKPEIAIHHLPRIWSYFKQTSKVETPVLSDRETPASIVEHLKRTEFSESHKPLTEFEKNRIPRYLGRVERGEDLERIITDLTVEVRVALYAATPATFMQRAFYRNAGINRENLTKNYYEKQAFLDYLSNLRSHTQSFDQQPDGNPHFGA